MIRPPPISTLFPYTTLFRSDMPYIAPGIVERLVVAYESEGKPITIPQYGGEVGPPTLFARQLFPDLLHLTGEARSEEHTSELQSQTNLVCRLLLEKKKKTDM